MFKPTETYYFTLLMNSVEDFTVFELVILFFSKSDFVIDPKGKLFYIATAPEIIRKTQDIE